MVTLAHTSTDAYQAMTEGVAVVDRSERGKLALTGAEAKEFMHGQVTNDVEGLEPGSGCYAAFLTHKGKMLGDLRILDTGDELLLDCERGALQDLFTMIRRFKLGRDVELHKRTLESGLLSLIGPDARRIAGATELPDVEHAHRAGRLGGAGVRVIATDVGVDVLCEAADAEPVAAALIAAGAVPAGDDAAEVRRVETGRPRYGVDLDDTVIPQEAGLNDRAVSFEKGCYVGQETVARLYFRGKPNRHLRGLKLSGPAAAGDALRLGEREVGRLGSVVASPRFGPIALALVRREAQPGVTVAVGDGDVQAEVVDLPFPPA
ncbi:MAG TPA: glycine cleavage T C-terminal barrel domain-containing protein [Solirubrobacteraceae bacterium]|nr:glycine cleavage T C-terminal barrel domain-containing protein [Solirubrobacteraceae bacterium]